MRVLAIALGIYKDARRRPGTEFEMDIPRQKMSDADGEVYVFPAWVVPATDLQRRVFAKRQELAEAKFADGAAYVSRNGRANKTFSQAMCEGRGPQVGGSAEAEAAAMAASGSAGYAAKKAARHAAYQTGRGPRTTLRT